MMRGVIAMLCLLLRIASSQQLDDVRLPPHFYQRSNKPQTVLVRIGHRTTLKCSAKGMPKPSISWLKDGVSINDDIKEINGSLELIVNPKERRGLYICLATNEFGAAVDTPYFVNQAYMIPHCSGKEQKTVSEGEAIFFPVSKVESHPPPAVTWTKSEYNAKETPQLQMNERIYMDVSGNLWFGYTELGDTSWGQTYKDVFENYIVDFKQGCTHYNLTVHKNPGIRSDTIEPKVQHWTRSPHTVIEKQELKLECFIPGKPAEIVKWSRKDRKPLASGRHKIDLWGYRLNINEVKQEDGGEYICEAGKAREMIHVVVEAAPEFEGNDFPHDMNVTEGDNVKINCTAYSIPPSNIEWFINVKKIKSSDILPRISISDDQQTLQIRDVCRDCSGDRQTDSMVVQCNASNIHGHLYASGYINILKKTQVKLVNGEHYYERETGYEKDSIVLNCTATSDPSTPVSPKWFNVTNPRHKEQLVSDSENMYVSGGILRFDMNGPGNKIWKHYDGKYACIANNSYSSSTLEVTIHVKNVSPVVANINHNWWILLIVFILLLLLLIAIVIHCQFNVGDTYNVNKKELRNGNDPIKEIDEKDFKIYSRPEQVDFKSSQATLVSKSSRKLSESGGEEGRFTEDGSFLGIYTGERQRSLNELA